MENQDKFEQQQYEDGQEYEEEEEVLDDDYLVRLHRYLMDMKNIRKKAEQDANLLDGRLRCLRDEELKTRKKIEVTRQKTDEKMLNIQRQEQKLLEKEAFRKKKLKELEMKKEQNQLQKQSIEYGTKTRAQEIRDQLNEDMNNLREQKKINEETRRYYLEEDQRNKKTQADYIKSQKLIANEKRRALELEKKNQIRLELERKIKEEEERITLAEERKQELESDEIAIMKKLKTTTKIHEQLIDDYNKLSGKKNYNI